MKKIMIMLLLLTALLADAKTLHKEKVYQDIFAKEFDIKNIDYRL